MSGIGNKPSGKDPIDAEKQFTKRDFALLLTQAVLEGKISGKEVTQNLDAVPNHPVQEAATLVRIRRAKATLVTLPAPGGSKGKLKKGEEKIQLPAQPTDLADEQNRALLQRRKTLGESLGHRAHDLVIANL